MHDLIPDDDVFLPLIRFTSSKTALYIDWIEMNESMGVAGPALREALHRQFGWI